MNVTRFAASTPVMVLKAPKFSALTTSQNLAEDGLLVRFGSTAPTPDKIKYHQTPESVKEILGKIKYKDDYFFVVHATKPNAILGWLRKGQAMLIGKPVSEMDMAVQVQYMAPDVAIPNSPATLRTDTRRFPIKSYYEPGQIFNSIVGALKAVEEHELREGFRYKGRKIFNPHFNTDAMQAYLKARLNEPKIPDTVYTDKKSVQSLISQCSIMGYKFEVERAEDIGGQKLLLGVKIVDDPQHPAEKLALSQDLEGKQITFVTTNTESKILHNLINNIVQEQMNELNWRLTYDGVPIYSTEIRVSDIEGYIESRGKAKR